MNTIVNKVVVLAENYDEILDYACSMDNDGDEEYEFDTEGNALYFDSTWGAVEDFVESLSNTFPEAQFIHTCADYENPGYDVKSRMYLNGRKIEECLPDDCTDVAYKLLFDVAPGFASDFVFKDGEWQEKEDEDDDDYGEPDHLFQGSLSDLNPVWTSVLNKAYCASRDDTLNVEVIECKVEDYTVSGVLAREDAEDIEAHIDALVCVMPEYLFVFRKEELLQVLADEEDDYQVLFAHDEHFLVVRIYK